MPFSLSNLYRFDEFELDPANRSLSRNGTAIPLSAKSCQVLSYLVANAGRVVTKDELLKAVWPESFVEESNLPGYISGLRKVLTDRASYIATVPGLGYKFTANVESRASSELRAKGVDFQLQQMRETTHVIIRDTSSSALALPAPKSFFHRWAGLWWTSAVLFILCGSYFGHALWKERHTPPAFATLVVGDFKNETGDATFDHTLRRAVEADLEQSPFLSVMGEREGFNTLRKMGHKSDEPLSAELAREVCERTNRQIALTGTIANLGGPYLLTLEAMDCRSGNPLTASKAEAKTKSGVLDALDAAIETVRRNLGESRKSTANFQVPISQVTTSSLEALEAYSTGLYISGQGGDESEVLPFYKKAIELDPQFAMAYAKLADVYNNDDETALAKQNYAKALSLGDHLSAREKMVLQAQYADATDMLQGVAAYKTWADMYPNDVLPVANLSDRYMQLGNFADAILNGQRALQLAPNNANEFDILARAYKRASQFDKAKAVIALGVSRGKDYVRLHDTLSEIAWAQDDEAAMAREAQWADQKGTWFSFDLEADIAADGGQLDRAEELWDRSITTANRDKLTATADVVRLDQADAERLLGQPARARATLQKIAKEDTDSAEFVLINIKLGQLAPAEVFLKAHPTIESQPPDPLTYLNLPRIRAALALAQNRPLDAIAALDGVQRFDLSDSGLNAMTLRGEAYLMAHQPDQAAVQYKKILLNPGLPVCPELSLAHLGLAKAEQMRGNLPAAEKEYTAFLERWKHADQHSVIVANAKKALDAVRERKKN